ncbi:MAG: right-handed parallel beta-helix repeat-containing protein [Planctomycetota bacterium]
MADNPPSGTVYDPEGDGIRLTSLGVHEHWNNPADKKYSRNLGTGDGIELAKVSFAAVDGPIENVANGKKYDLIRHAISEANPGDKIVVSEGVYRENVNLGPVNLTLSSTDPNDPAVVAATVLEGGSSSGQIVTFTGGEAESCVLAGFTMTGAETGVYCVGASPTIADCHIENNGGAGIELYEGSNPTIANCEITSNVGAGIKLQVMKSGRIVLYNHPMIINCIISANGQYGISGGMPTITNCTIVANGAYGISSLEPTVTNSIVYYNGFAQIESDLAAVAFSDVQGDWPGDGNIDAVPCFAEPGFWSLNGTPEDPSDDYWVRGDYHLRSQAGRWDPRTRSWVQDVLTSPCIDAGNPDSDWTAESWPNGGRINMGAYGGTPQASMSLSAAP